MEHPNELIEKGKHYDTLVRLANEMRQMLITSGYKEDTAVIVGVDKTLEEVKI